MNLLFVKNIPCRYNICGDVLQVQLDSLTGKEMVDLLNTIFREVQAQTLKVNDRKHIYDILSYILLHFLQGKRLVCILE